jgi:Ras family protein T1
MKAFTQKPFSEVYEPTMEPFNVVNSVEMKGVEKYLVVRSSVFYGKADA